MSNKEKFQKLVKPGNAQALKEKLQWRKENREWLNHSAKVAFRIQLRLKEMKWSQRQLAEAMSVTPQYINTLLKGQENLSTSTYLKLEKVLGISFLIGAPNQIFPSVKTDIIKECIVVDMYKYDYKESAHFAFGNTMNEPPIKYHNQWKQQTEA